MNHKATVNTKDNKGQTPLFYASSAGSIENLLELLHYDADVNIRSKLGRTVLRYSRSHETILTLMKYGAETTGSSFRKGDCRW